MTFLRASIVIIALLAIVFAADQKQPSFDVPVLSTEVNQFGGRPGSFHFVTNEQTMADARELKDAMAALDRLDAETSKLDFFSRQALEPDLRVVRKFALNVHLGRNSNAGPKAAEVEARLNEAKGNFMCGACHGHGMHQMMHGGQGGGMMRGGPHQEQPSKTPGQPLTPSK
ncbi:MAG TPA: hypothetical protein VN577_15970 [Terriglobales bacterium]|nr:hypothetical protein [Terriglobales bacterium]